MEALLYRFQYTGFLMQAIKNIYEQELGR